MTNNKKSKKRTTKPKARKILIQRDDGYDFKFSSYLSCESDVDDDLKSKIRALEGAYCNSYSKDIDGWDGLVEAAMELVVLTTGMGGYVQYRFNKMDVLMEYMQEYEKQLPAKGIGFLQEIWKNPKETPLFQALAAHLLVMDSMYNDEFCCYTTGTVEQLRENKQRKLDLILSVVERCQAVPASDRKEIIVWSGEKTVEAVVEWLQGYWEEDIEEIKEELRGPIELDKEEEKLKELYRLCSSEDVLPSPPSLSAEALKSVAELPEFGKTLLVIQQNMRYAHLCEGPEKENINTNRHRMFHGEDYSVYLVNHERFMHGKRRNVFKPVQVCLLHKDDPLAKKAIGPLLLACVKPYQYLRPDLIPPLECPPERPKKILFVSEEIASNAQVKLFTSMMGCNDIQVADPTMIELLKETRDEIHAPNQKLFPHLYDAAKGIKCSACPKLGTCLQKCPCNKVYYCSRDCQEADWKLHKAPHKQAMARCNAKKKGKAYTA